MMTPDLHAKWLNYQKDSESLVIGSIFRNFTNVEQNSKFNLFYIEPSNDGRNDLSADFAYQVLNEIENRDESINSENINVRPYTSQYGLQGEVFSTFILKLNFSLDALYNLTSALFALFLIVLYSQYSNIFADIKFFPIFCFVISAVSPWTASIARNLYWVPFTWILPSIIALALWKVGSVYGRSILFVLLSLSVTIKSLCGYEFLSFIFLLSIIPFCYLFILKKEERKKIAKFIFLVLLFEFIGFCFAIVIHAGSRADTVWDGLQSIWELDVRRRTFGEANEFGLQYKASLEASIFDVIVKYIGSLPYLLLISISCILMVVTYIKSKSLYVRNIGVLSLLFILPPLSWYILAKAHSYIHTHINFVLLDFGFIPCLLLSVFTCVHFFWKSFLKKPSKL